MDRLSIPQYFKDKEIFITGGTGFIGKVLIEKLLRSCPDLKTIYLLIRPKKGTTVQRRIEEILNNGLFDVVRRSNPDNLKKVVAVSGDVSELNLGLSQDDRESILGVHVVFHAAASVRFDDPLRKAILMNTRGTREMMELLLEMRNLEVAVHVSTTYCNTDKEVIEERPYRDHGDWKEAIRIAEEYQNEYELKILSKKCIGCLGNTYLFTKHLAENIVEDYSDRLPLVIFRPGVVLSVWQEPVPGWVDNMNGPIGLTTAVGKGILRIMYSKPDVLLDYTPVDIIIKALILATWTRAVRENSVERLPTYNCSSIDYLRITQVEAYDIGMKVVEKTPYDTVWFPRCHFTDNFSLFCVLYFICSVVPGYIVDTILELSGRKPMLMKVLRKIYFAVLSVGYFTTQNWDFRSENFWNLRNNLLPEDRADFYYSLQGFDPAKFAENAMIGCSTYLLKESHDAITAIKKYNRNKRMYYILLYSLYGVLFYTLFTSQWVRGVVADFGSFMYADES